MGILGWEGYRWAGGRPFHHSLLSPAMLLSGTPVLPKTFGKAAGILLTRGGMPSSASLGYGFGGGSHRVECLRLNTCSRGWRQLEGKKRALRPPAQIPACYRPPERALKLMAEMKPEIPSYLGGQGKEWASVLPKAASSEGALGPPSQHTHARKP